VARGDLTISGSTFTGNHTNHSGGALYLDSGDTVIVDSSFTQNAAATRGGAIFAGNHSLTVRRSTIADNIAGTDGGGAVMAIYSADLTIERSTISGNTSGLGGGGVKISGTGDLELLDSTIAGNSVRYYGGGLYLKNSGTVGIFNSTISGNSGAQAGGVYAGDGTGVQIVQSTITDNWSIAPYALPPIGGIQVGGGDPIVVSRRARLGAPARTREARPDHQRRESPGTESVGLGAPLAPGHLQLTGVIVAGNDNVTSIDLGAGGNTTVQVESDHSIIGSIQTPNVVVTDLGGTQIGVTAAAAGNSVLFQLARPNATNTGTTLTGGNPHDFSAPPGLGNFATTWSTAPTVGTVLWEQELPQTTGSSWEEFPPAGYEWGVPLGSGTAVASGGVHMFINQSILTGTTYNVDLIWSE
jgi:predicted outer membrane repeat protein